MDKIQYFFNKHKKDIFYTFVLLAIFVFCAVWLGDIYGDYLIDCGREAYLPSLLLKGKLLFRDIFAMYNPLAYQINAVLYFIFGESLNVLYGAGYLCSFLIVFGIYSICRYFTTEYNSFALCFLIMILYVFRHTICVNYILPYSFAMIYAVLFGTYSVLAFLNYLKTDKMKYAYISCFLLGTSLANKPEFIFCIIPILLFLIIKNAKIKSYIFTLILFVLPTLFSYGIMFMQGFTIHDLKTYFDFIHNFFNTDEQIYYNTTKIAPTWTVDKFMLIAEHFANFICFCILAVVYFSCLNRNKLLKICFWIFLPVFIFYTYIFSENHYYDKLLSWVVVASAIILLLLLNRQKTEKNQMLFF